MTDSQIHWFSIVNSIMIVLFLTGMIAMIMMRTLHRDLMRYNQQDQSEEAAQEEKEESGWKLIYSEVFRPPAHGGSLSVLIGTGVQVRHVACTRCVLAVWVAEGGSESTGVHHDAADLGLRAAGLPVARQPRGPHDGPAAALRVHGVSSSACESRFVKRSRAAAVRSVVAGYFSTRVYKMFKLTEWKKNTFYTAIAFPGFCFTVFFILNLFVWGKKSSGAVPFGTLIALLVLWFGISVPLVYIGSYLAFKKPAIEPPVTVNHIPRMIPDQVCALCSRLQSVWPG
jgi:transmembrane 9 superfamily protein 2/4